MQISKIYSKIHVPILARLTKTKIDKDKEGNSTVERESGPLQKFGKRNGNVSNGI